MQRCEGTACAHSVAPVCVRSSSVALPALCDFRQCTRGCSVITFFFCQSQAIQPVTPQPLMFSFSFHWTVSDAKMIFFQAQPQVQGEKCLKQPGMTSFRPEPDFLPFRRLVEIQGHPGPELDQCRVYSRSRAHHANTRQPTPHSAKRIWSHGVIPL